MIEKAIQPRTKLYSLQSLEHYAKSGAAVPGIDLGSLTPDLSGAVPVLIKIANGGHRRFATQSLRILGLIGPEASDAVPIAIELLESDFYDFRAESAAALGGFGVGNREVVEALVASLDREKTTDQRIAQATTSRVWAGSRGAIATSCWNVECERCHFARSARCAP